MPPNWQKSPPDLAPLLPPQYLIPVSAYLLTLVSSRPTEEMLLRMHPQKLQGLFQPSEFAEENKIPNGSATLRGPSAF